MDKNSNRLSNFLFTLDGFFFLKFFVMWTITKVFIEFVTILPLFYVLAARYVGSQLPDQGLNPLPLCRKVKS